MKLLKLIFLGRFLQLFEQVFRFEEGAMQALRLMKNGKRCRQDEEKLIKIYKFNTSFVFFLLNKYKQLRYY